jgi:hypothetical protein
MKSSNENIQKNSKQGNLTKQQKVSYNTTLESVKIAKKDSNHNISQNQFSKKLVQEPPLQITSNNANKTSRMRLTLMLMTFPITYLITTFPLFVIITCQLIGHYFVGNFKVNFENEFAIFRTLMFSNNSFNILFFILFGKSLRKDMLSLFLCSYKTAKYINTSRASFNIKSNNNPNNVLLQSPRLHTFENRTANENRTNSTKCSPIVLSREFCSFNHESNKNSKLMSAPCGSGN